jgi:hypothetical protein
MTVCIPRAEDLEQDDCPHQYVGVCDSCAKQHAERRALAEEDPDRH